MDVDAAKATLLFKKLTDEEHAQYHTEGRCFRCHTQGHMARNCPKNNNLFNQMNANIHESTNVTITTTSPVATPSTTSPAPTPPTAPPAPPVPLKLSFAQQIHALEERMTEEERGAHLNTHNMGKDFCAARY
jgi:hypothetical protein